VPAAKLIVLGRGEAGKSTLIARLTGTAMNIEVRGRTVAMDHGILRHGGWTISLVGVPGQARFAGVRESLVRGAVGAIWVHPAGEAADPQTVDLLALDGARGLPYVVFVNQRADTDGGDDFTCPERLHPPCSILHGDLASATLRLEELTETAWRLAGGRPELPPEEA